MNISPVDLCTNQRLFGFKFNFIFVSTWLNSTWTSCFSYMEKQKLTVIRLCRKFHTLVIARIFNYRAIKVENDRNDKHSNTKLMQKNKWQRNQLNILKISWGHSLSRRPQRMWIGEKYSTFYCKPLDRMHYTWKYIVCSFPIWVFSREVFHTMGQCIHCSSWFLSVCAYM